MTDDELNEMIVDGYRKFPKGFRETDTAVYFWDGILSNWYGADFMAPAPFVPGGDISVRFNCAEQYMMAMKALMFQDLDAYGLIMEVESPMIQKAIGRKVRGFDAEEWNAVSRDVVYPGIRAKFEQNPDLKEYLLGTKDKILVEASPYDKIWGVGLHYMDPLIEDQANWDGTNWLGEVLMRVRKDLTPPENPV